MNEYFVSLTVTMHVACARLQKEQVIHSKRSFTDLCFRDHDLLKNVFWNVFSFVCMEKYQINIVY